MCSLDLGASCVLPPTAGRRQMISEATSSLWICFKFSTQDWNLMVLSHLGNMVYKPSTKMEMH